MCGDERLQCGGEAQLVEFGGSVFAQDASQAVLQAARRIGRPLGGRANHLGVGRPAKVRRLDPDRGAVLRQLVVQLAGERDALALLHRHELASKLAVVREEARNPSSGASRTTPGRAT